MGQIKFTLNPLPPFSLNLTLWVLRRRPQNTWDLWDGRTYQRVLSIHNQAVIVSINQLGSVNKPQLEITAQGRKIRAQMVPLLKLALERILGLQVDLSRFYQLAEKDSRLRPLIIKFWGFKPTCYPTIFEALVNAITCQQFTLNAGISLLGKLVGKWGIALNDYGPRGFPRPQDLAHLPSEDLRALGFSQQKARALIELARRVEEGYDLEELNSLSDEEATKNLQQLRGVGRWTAEYVLLRGLGRIHIFPGDDLGIRSKLVNWLGIKEPINYEGVMQILNKWYPFGGLVYFLLLLKGLEEKGYIFSPPNKRASS